MNKIKNLIKNMQDLSLETLIGLRYALLGAVLVDIFGIYWYFGLKSLGMALMVVILISLGVVLFLERRKQPKMDEDNRKEEQEEEDKELKPKKPKNDDDNDETLDFGLPDAEEYNKRLEKAVGGF